MRECVTRFFKLLLPTENPNFPSERGKAILLLIEVAFRAYRHEWNGFDVRKWEWPFTALKEGSFVGDQPWTVCLRRAFELSKECGA